VNSTCVAVLSIPSVPSNTCGRRSSSNFAGLGWRSDQETLLTCTTALFPAISSTWPVRCSPSPRVRCTISPYLGFCKRADELQSNHHTIERRAHLDKVQNSQGPRYAGNGAVVCIRLM
jgi:hypothetical protein